MNDILILATEGGIPTSNPWSQLALPLGILIFVGSVFMLLRSNLGTRRGYLVMASALWGFAFILSMFWAFGAPGTPPNTGPQNLPGQELDEYQPVWIPFAADSDVVTREGSAYSAAADYPDGWEPVPSNLEDGASIGAQDINSFFSSLDANDDFEFSQNLLVGTEEQVGDTLYAEADNGRPMVAVTLGATCALDFDDDDDEETPAVLPPYCADAGLEVGDLIPEDAAADNGDSLRNEQTFFAFFDAGAPYFPSLLMIGILGLLFVLHVVLLARDETRERREAETVASDEDVEARPRTTVSV